MEVDGEAASLRAGLLAQFEGDDVRLRAASPLLDHGEVARGQPTCVEGVADCDRPLLVEVVEAVGTNTRPVVDRHRKALRVGDASQKRRSQNASAKRR